jgi:hypothetical protein
MIQTVVTYAIVIAAAGFVVWRVLLPNAVRARVRQRFAKDNHCGDDCGCS